MIKTLETLGNLLSSDTGVNDEENISRELLCQWLEVMNAATNGGSIETAVNRLDASGFGSAIVPLVGSLRNEEVVKHISTQISWAKLLHRNQFPTESRSRYHTNSFRHRVLSNLTEQSFWIREFGTDQPYEDRFENTAFVFRTAVKQGSMSFEHLVPTTLFDHPVPFGTAVLAQQLGERYYIFENTPFENIAVEYQADFFVAGCLHLGAREDHLDPEERTLGEGRLKQLLNTMMDIDVNQPYPVSDYLCQTFGWNRGTVCPLGVLGLSILAATPIHSKFSTEFATQILNTLLPQNTEISFSLLCDALIHTSSWKTVRGHEYYGPINSQIVHRLLQQDSCVVKEQLLCSLEHSNQWSGEHKNMFRYFMIEASKMPRHIFSLKDAPAFLKGCLELFDVRSSNDSWGVQKIWNEWWHGAFNQSLQWFDPDSEQQITTFMKPYLIAMAGLAISSRDEEQRMQCKLLLETLDPHEVCAQHIPRKLKI